MELMLCLYQLTLAQVESGKMMFMVGTGGNGKGMHSILDQCMLGTENFGLLESSWFSDRNEFRKSAHIGINKMEIRIQEASNSSPINSDQYKKFVVGETLTLRQNYEKTRQENFGVSIKIQEVNEVNIPRMDFNISRY